METAVFLSLFSCVFDPVKMLKIFDKRWLNYYNRFNP